MIQITISNNIRIRGASTPLRAAVTAKLTVDNPEFKKRKARRQPTWGIKPKLQLYTSEGTDLIVPRGFRRELVSLVCSMELANQTQETILQTDGIKVDFGNWSTDFMLSDSQYTAIQEMLGNSGCLIAPAGSGKTVMGLRYVFFHKVSALWITHTKDLLEQTAKRAKQCMPDVGEIGKLAEGTVSWGSGKLIIATVQTLQANPELVEQLNQFIGTVVVDECHHLPAACFMEVIGQLKARHMLGLTATPDRKDGLESYMYAGIGPKLYEIDRQGLYDSGRLIKPEIKFVYTDFCYEQASIRSSNNAVDAGGEELDYRDLLNKLIADEDRLDLIARNIYAQDGSQIVIADSIPYCHAIHLELRKLLCSKKVAVVHGPLQRWGWKVCRNESQAEDMIQSGKANAYRYNKSVKRWQVQVKNYTDQEYKEWNISTAERKQVMQDAANRKIDILIATGQLVQEGLDLPHLNHGHLVTPKRGDGQDKNNGAAVEQAIGRIMRIDPLQPDKKAVWWDYVDYNVGVLKAQYNSRRKVYNRLGLKVPAKPKRDIKDLEKFLNDLKY